MPSGSSSARRGVIAALGVVVVALALLVVWQAAPLLSSPAAGDPSPLTTAAAPSTVGQEPTAEPASPTTTPTAPPPTEPPPPPRVASALTGLLIDPEAALRRPIAVMVDDHVAARPQSGFNAASIVWHAPAEGGVPRYMMIFQDEIPAGVGPIRSAREYYIEWAAEWNAMYVHHGGSPQALGTLARKGRGQWVWNADGFRWEGRYLWRVKDRRAPHNLFTDGEHLRDLAERLGAADAPLTPAWQFEPEANTFLRPVGGSVTVIYPYERITYRYDHATNRYVRYINASKTPQVDGADGAIVAPTNVVILRMHFGPLNDGHPEKYRLEADNIGSGEAWIASNGVTVKGTWRKASATAPTLLFGPDGSPITLAQGQTFVQVLALSYGFEVTPGTFPWLSPPSSSPAATTSPS